MTFVTKRNGSEEPLNIDKIHKMVEKAVNGLTGVSASVIEMNSGVRFVKGITTADIQSSLVQSATNLITENNPNYQYAAARLLLFGLQKDVWGGKYAPALIEVINQNIQRQVYDSQVLEKYSLQDIEKVNTFIKHKRDFDFVYAGLEQVISKYLVQDRITKEIFETPQFMYIMIALTLFQDYPGKTRLRYVKRFYDAVSTFKISLPTPIMAGVRTTVKQYASCSLIDVDDTLDSWYYSNSAVGKYIAQRAGIGLNMGRIRSIGSKVRKGEVVHTGAIPVLKMFEATVKSSVQNGVRGGSATVFYPIWAKEINDIIVLKNNKGSDDNRVRKLDYAIQISKLFYQRLQKDENIMLFSTNDVPGLYEAFGTEAFDELYINYENDESIPKKQISAVDLFSSLVSERVETGRIYIMNIDHTNSHSSFQDKINMSNLCVAPETKILTKEGYIPIEDLEDEEVEVWNGEEWSSTVVRKTGIDQSVVRVRIGEYESIECTPYHKFYVLGNGQPSRAKIIEKRAIDLQPGDKLIKCKFPVIEGTKELEHAWVLGFHTGDGSYHRNTPVVTLHGVKKDLVNLFPERVVYDQKDGGKRVMLDIDVPSKFQVPGSNFTIASRLKWLAGYSDADGYVHSQGFSQSLLIPCINIPFLLEVRAMLQTLGVDCKVTKKRDAEYHTFPNGRTSWGQEIANLIISGPSLYQLYQLGFSNYLKRLKLWGYEPQRNSINCHKITSIPDEGRTCDTYCFTEPKRHMGIFNGFISGNCMEITLPTRPINDVRDLVNHDPNYETDAEVALCTLSAINVGKINDLNELEDLCDLAVRGLDALIDHMKYPIEAARVSAHNRRSLGIGFIGFATYLAKNKAKYTDDKALRLTHDLAEAFQFNLLRASNQLAKQRGPCGWFDKTKYSQGLLPIDHYKKDVDELVQPAYTCDWDTLREDIKTYGLRNSTLSAQMPAESSAVVSNSTNGIEPPRALLSVKKSKKGILPMLVPNVHQLKNYYTLLWDDPELNEGYLKIVAVMQKFFDQSISANTSYNHAHYPDNKVPLMMLLQHILTAYKFGIKTLYYHNTEDGKTDETVENKEKKTIEEKEQECDSCSI